MVRVMVDGEHGNRSVVDRAIGVSNARSLAEGSAPSALRPLRSERDGFSRASGRQRLAARFLAERQQQQADEKRDRRQRHRRADGVEVGDAGADEEGDAGAGESSDRRREGERAARGTRSGTAPAATACTSRSSRRRDRGRTARRRTAPARSAGRRRSRTRPRSRRTSRRSTAPSVSRRPSASASGGRTRQPRIVPAESTIVPYDARRAASAAVKPSRSAISRTDVGT